MTQMTPPLKSSGAFTLIAPWATVPDTVYTCIAIRAFQDLLQHGTDVVGTYYAPVGLGNTQYQADLVAGANLITLVSENQPTIYVPDTYIKSYPDLSNVGYSNLVLSCLLGPLPDKLDLSFLTAQMAGVVSDTIGVTPAIQVHVSPSTQVVTAEQAQTMETARAAAITNRTTDRARVLTLQTQNNSLNQQIATLTQILIDNGLLGGTPAPAPTPTPAPSP